jgi:L-ascorbate metabolism protein UlaG (beta-lactamase superfamily)
MMSQNFESDTFETTAGELKITFIGHGSLMFTFDGKIIHVDPVGREADYARLPKADIILVTHEHPDHLDPDVLDLLQKDKTLLVVTEICAGLVGDCVVMKNGDIRTADGLNIEAVPAYNMVHMRSEGIPFHPKGSGNGYMITFGDTRVYVAGDTENIPEMRNLENVDIAFLPMNLPYTMTPEMAAEAAQSFMPKILYPYHFGDSDTGKLVDLLEDNEDIDIRIRSLK